MGAISESCVRPKPEFDGEIFSVRTAHEASEYWNDVMSEQLNQNQDFHTQPQQRRQKFLTSELKIRQQPGRTLPAKRHPDYKLAVRCFFKKRERNVNIEGFLPLYPRSNATKNCGQSHGGKSHGGELSSSMFFFGFH